jgi:triacylglycerol esterase/lipase EstA (alpha/beta hydrolase family)
MATIGLILKILFFATLAFAFLQSFITHFVLLYEMRLSALEHKTPLSLKPWIFIKSLGVETFCYFCRFWLMPFLKLSFKPQVDSQTPILLVHGYRQNQMDWLWFRYQLKNQDVGPVYSLNLYPATVSITELAQLVKNKVQDIQEETGQSKIILIGHSMGGLVSSYYAEFLAEPGQVLSIITLGSPFQGTKLAALGCGQNVREMAPHSSFLKEITERIQRSTIQYRYVASKIDNLIVPWQSALPIIQTNENDQLILEDHGHLKLLISPTVVDQVVKWLKRSSIF